MVEGDEFFYRAGDAVIAIIGVGRDIAGVFCGACIVSCLVCGVSAEALVTYISVCSFDGGAEVGYCFEIIPRSLEGKGCLTEVALVFVFFLYCGTRVEGVAGFQIF